MQFLHFWGFFDSRPKYRFFSAQNSQKMFKNTSKSLSDSPNISQIHWMMLYNDIWKIEKIAKIDHFSSYSPFGSKSPYRFYTGIEWTSRPQTPDPNCYPKFLASLQKPNGRLRPQTPLILERPSGRK